LVTIFSCSRSVTHYPTPYIHKLQHQFQNYTEKGIASWYGPNFHGKKTANGEIYNMYALTAAHKLLPFNTRVLVTNLSNNKQVVVRINDRGPFVKNRIIDLSYLAAKKIQMITTGTAPVLLKVIEIPHCQRQIFFIQVGSFTSKINAYRTYFALQKMGYKKSRLIKIKLQGQIFWRVQAGEFPSLKRAKYALKKLEKYYPNSFILAR